MPEFRENTADNAALQLQYAYGASANTPEGLPRNSLDQSLTTDKPTPDKPTPEQPKFKSRRRLTQKGTKQILRYPVAEIYDTTDYLQIKVVRYKTIPVNSGEENKIVGEPGKRRNSTNKEESLATIFLPIPSAIQDRNSVSYQGSNINAITGAAVEGVQNIMEGGQNMFDAPPLETLTKMKQTITGAVKNTFSQAGGLPVITDLITKSLASQAVGVFGGNVSVDQLLARGEGIVFNPNMELLFNGPSLRQFAFSFQMTPRSQA